MNEPAPPPGPAERERRARPDRRLAPTPMLSRYTLWGRRRRARRESEEECAYVDRPGPWTTLAFTCVVGLSLLDAWYTLDLLKQGATEANPVMRMALSISDQAFILVKTVVTLLGAGFLCMHKNWPLGRICLVFALVGYSALLFYHLYAQHLVHL